jgi:DNA polymerase-3 subunit delta'
MRFADIIGQPTTVKYLQNAVRTGNVAQAYILAGMPGTGKKTLASRFAQALVCTEFNALAGEPCDACIACRQAANGNHPDVVNVTHEKTIISVNDIREQVVSDVQIKPYYGGKKVYIIEDAELMKAPAQNALLKTLEEPPDFAVFMLLTATEDALLPTIRSRSFLLRINPLPSDTLASLMIDACGGNEQKAAFVGTYSRGSLGAALALAQDEEAYVHASELVKLQITYISEALSQRVRPDTEVRFMASLLNGRQCNADNMDLLKRLFRDILVCKGSKNADSITFTSFRDEIETYAPHLSYEGISRVLSLLDEVVRANRYNVNPDPLVGMIIDEVHKAKT